MTRPTVVVTGASAGIGEAVSREFLSRGWAVFGTVRRTEDGARLREELGDAFTPLVCDVRDAASMKVAALSVSLELRGRCLSCLVCNAGVAPMAPLLLQPLDEFQAVLDVNVVGVLRSCQAFSPLLGTDLWRTGRPGRVVNISSDYGSYAAPFWGAYCASKWAVEGLSRTLRQELRPFGIGVVVIAPGYVRTPILERGGAQQEKMVAAARATVWEVPFRRAIALAQEGIRGGGSSTPQAAARVICRAAEARRATSRRVCIHRRMGWLWDWLFPVIVLPWWWLDRVLCEMVGLDRTAPRGPAATA